MAHSLIWEDTGVYWKYSGQVSGEEIVDASSQVYGDERFDDLKYKLVDFLDAECIEIRVDQVALVAYQHRAAEMSNSSIQTAIVAKPEFEQANTFALFFEDSNWDVKVFNNMDDANCWLNRK